MQTGPALTVLVYKDKTAKQLRRRVLQDFTFPVASLFARPVLARLKQYPIANLPEDNERSANLHETLSATVLFFLGDTFDCG